MASSLDVWYEWSIIFFKDIGAVLTTVGRRFNIRYFLYSNTCQKYLPIENIYSLIHDAVQPQQK